MNNPNRPKSKMGGLSTQAPAKRKNPREPSSSRLAKVGIPDFPPTASKISRQDQNEQESMRSRNPRFDSSALDGEEKLKQSRRN